MRKHYNQFTENKYTREELFLLAQKCANRKEFNAKGYERCAKNQNILVECRKILDENRYKYENEKHKQLISQIEQNLPKYKSIMLFRTHHPRLYYYIYTRKLTQYLNFYIKQKYSTHQMICKQILEKLLNTTCMFNTRKVLEGKELDIFFKDYNLACEYNGFYWHKNKSEKDEIKKEQCRQKNITLCVISEQTLNVHADIEYAIDDIKQQFITYLPSIKKATGKTIEESHIREIIIDKNELFKESFNINDIEYIINNCSRYSEVKNKYNKIWQYLLRNKMLHVLDPIKNRDYIYMNKERFLVFVLTNFKTYTLFTKHKSYAVGRKKKYLTDIKQSFETKQHNHHIIV